MAKEQLAFTQILGPTVHMIMKPQPGLLAIYTYMQPSPTTPGITIATQFEDEDAGGDGPDRIDPPRLNLYLSEAFLLYEHLNEMFMGIVNDGAIGVLAADVEYYRGKIRLFTRPNYDQEKT